MKPFKNVLLLSFVQNQDIIQQQIINVRVVQNIYLQVVAYMQIKIVLICKLTDPLLLCQHCKVSLHFKEALYQPLTLPFALQSIHLHIIFLIAEDQQHGTYRMVPFDEKYNLDHSYLILIKHFAFNFKHIYKRLLQKFKIHLLFQLFLGSSQAIR